MKNSAVLRQRKEMKKRSHGIVRSHYIMLVFLMLILTLFGVEYTSSVMGWGNLSGSKEGSPGNVLGADDVIVWETAAGAEEAGKQEEQVPQEKQDSLEEQDSQEGSGELTAEGVWKTLISGRLTEGMQQADRLEKDLKTRDSIPKALGRTNGVLAQIVNAAGSGHLAAKLAQTIRTFIRSDQAVAGILILVSFLFFSMIFIFLKNVYSAVVRRIFLEARVYPQISFLDVLHFAAVHKWMHASWVMLVRYVYGVLWSLTVVGGFIKHYSYYAVPYIVAENPGLSAGETIRLSRRMMNGHKMEALLYDVTLFGWDILGILTFGISNLLYGNSYTMACRTEFYAKVRELAIRENLEGIQSLNDRYLFERADRILLAETYFDVVDEITQIHENKTVLSGAQKVLVDWFGIWIGSLKQKKIYDEQQRRSFAVEHYRKCMNQEMYPQWLNPLWEKRELGKQGNVTYLCSYTIWTLFLLYIAFSFAGWSWEVALHFMQTGQLVNRGTLHGPWLPIYGTGGIIVLILCSKFRKKPVLEFISAILLCGTLEYFSGWYLEMTYHTRWWSYDGYFLNLHGRICAEGLLVFGVGCCAVVYLLAPVFDYLIAKVKEKVLIGVCLVLFLTFGADSIYSRGNPNMAEGAIEEETTETGNSETEEELQTGY